MWDVIWEILWDTAKTLPFLFAAFLLVEWAEHRAGHYLQRIVRRSGNAGPFVGALAGCLPQCGFSVIAANLYAAGMISAGTLFAVFLATSDEAVLVLLSVPGSLAVVGRLLVCKWVLAVCFGLVTDLLLRRMFDQAGKDIHQDICDSCGCENSHSILRPAIRHTFRVAIYLLLVSLVLGIFMECAGEGLLRRILFEGSPFQPFLCALAGLIPNCAVSVVLTRLLLTGNISFGAAVAGLASGAGVGLLVLFRINRNLRENLRITVFLYLFAAFGGLLLQLLGV